jgi:single-strand DNA-binding protein
MIHATISGNIGRDPELREVGSSQVLKFSLASNSRQKVDGKWQGVTTWLDVSLWRRAEALSKLVAKGQYVTVRGEVYVREYTDKHGAKRYSVDLDADAVELGPKRDGQQPAVRDTQPTVPEQVADDPNDSELPF